MDLKKTLNMVVRVLISCWFLCFNPHQSIVRQAHHGFQPEPSQAAFSSRHLENFCCVNVTFFWVPSLQTSVHQDIFTNFSPQRRPVGKIIAHLCRLKPEFRVIQGWATSRCVNFLRDKKVINWLNSLPKSSGLGNFAKKSTEDHFWNDYHLVICWNVQITNLLPDNSAWTGYRKLCG